MDCILCKIIAKTLPNYTVYEAEHILAFLDIHPQAKGHTVVVPKQHAPSIFDLADEDIKTLAVGVKRSMERIKTVLSPDGFNVGWNHAAAGGQMAPHIHVHIFPRWQGDGGGSMHSIINNPGDMSLADLAQLF